MNTPPLVSCVINFFNAEKFFQEAIESVLAQTYHHWELLLVDDGSTDGSTQIALEYAQKYPDKVYYLEHENHQNKGTSAARNLGMQKAQGKYIAFLDADDIWLPHKLEKQVALLDAHPTVGMIYDSLYYWYSWTENPEDVSRDYEAEIWNFPDKTILEYPEYLTLFVQEKVLVPSPTCIVIRRDVMTKVGGFEESFRDLFDDQVFVAKMSLEAPIMLMRGFLEKWRRHQDSCTFKSENITGEGQRMREVYLNWLEQYFLKLEIKEEQLWRVLKQQLLPYRSPRLYQFWQKVYSLKKNMKSFAEEIALKIPIQIRTLLKTQWQNYRQKPPVGWVRFGSLRRVTPISRMWPNYRGNPIDRYYIENFIGSHAEDIQGRVLEMGDATYIRKFGGDRVTHPDIMAYEASNNLATIIGDLTQADHVPSNTFDCFILTQTLLLIYDVRAAIKTAYRILKPGGILLVTIPGISHLCRGDRDIFGQYWCFTTDSARRLFTECFPENNVKIEAYGNVLSTTAFLYGLSTQELHQKELDYHDPDYEFIISVRAVKPQGEPTEYE